eukprot:TRINITY_DN4079_c0_g1_i1.p1 TRINITY_DN4079_c0_g1~~TRINITY_DN4079_c0_g1_i1.p1  ORF type:complete len:629 (-),score=204.15 TRINITY_DN4079_c0_g1_i1:471-2318(-)
MAEHQQAAAQQSLHETICGAVAELIARHAGMPSASQAAALFAAPTAKGVTADFAVTCFPVAMAMAKRDATPECPKPKPQPAPAVANALADLINKESERLGVQATASGPFLNLTYSPAAIASVVMPVLGASPVAALRSATGAGRTVCIDFSSPNIAKHLAFHHIRSTMIGNCLANMYDAAGWRAVRINFLGDWGTAFGRLISGWKREGLTMEQLNAAEDKVTFLNQLYVRASQAAEGNAELEEDARRWSKKLEDGDADARYLWQTFKDASLAEFNSMYKLLNVSFDSWKGEAYYEDKMLPIINELEEKHITSVDKGATIVDLTKLVGKKFSKPALIKRADGGTLYATRDLTACDDRFAEYKFARSLYVVDLGQSLHFQEWFAIAKLLGRPYVNTLRHVGFGVVLIEDEDAGWCKGKTRTGKALLLKDVLNEAIKKAEPKVREKNTEMDAAQVAEVSRAVGVGAVVFNNLRNGRVNDVKFKYEEALRFDGETAPYLQYAHARLCSIERNFAKTYTNAPAPNPALLTAPAEKQVLLCLVRLQAILERAVETDEPSCLCTGMLQLASVLSTYLTAGTGDRSLRVLSDDAALASSRLQLVSVTRAVLCEGLRLLGLIAPA